MKIFQFIVAVGFVALVIILIVSNSRRTTKLYKADVSGEIIAVEKKIKGNYSIKFLQNGKARVLTFHPDEAPAIGAGDSIFKKANSNSFYVKKRNQSGLEELLWKDIHIGGEWED